VGALRVTVGALRFAVAAVERPGAAIEKSAANPAVTPAVAAISHRRVRLPRLSAASRAS
jgi:hypothetical protein